MSHCIKIKINLKQENVPLLTRKPQGTKIEQGNRGDMQEFM